MSFEVSVFVRSMFLTRQGVRKIGKMLTILLLFLIVWRGYLLRIVLQQSSYGNVHLQEVEKPLDIGTVYSFPRNHMAMKYNRSHKFNRPFVFKSYIRRKYLGSSKFEVFLFMTGISMGYLKRNLTVVGCLIGPHAYEANFFGDDIAICKAFHPPRRNESVTAILLKDKVFNLALSGPVELFFDYFGEMKPGDVLEMPRHVKLHGALNEYRHEELAIVNSVETYSGYEDVYDWTQTKGLRRYQVCMATQISSSTKYLHHWIDYHRKIGIDMVYVIDNESEENLAEVFKDREDVAVLYWPWRRTQTQAFTYFEVVGRPRCQWMLFADVDEYVMLAIGKNIHKYTMSSPLWDFIEDKRRQGYKQLMFRYITMTNSGNQFQVQPLPEHYVHLNEEQNTHNGKSICETDNDWVGSYVHICISRSIFYRNESTYDLSQRFKLHGPLNLYPSSWEDEGALIHFKKLSWEDQVLRLARPPGSLMSGQKNGSWKILDVNNPPSEYLKLQNDTTQYTYFRDIFRKVMKSLSDDTQIWTWRKDNSACQTSYSVSKKTSMTVCQPL